MSETKKCVFCGNKADWDNLGGICNDCYNRMETQDAIARIRADERAKVIEEFLRECKKRRFKSSKYTSINVVDYADIVEIAEQLKEQGND